MRGMSRSSAVDERLSYLSKLLMTKFDHSLLDLFLHLFLLNAPMETGWKILYTFNLSLLLKKIDVYKCTIIHCHLENVQRSKLLSKKEA